MEKETEKKMEKKMKKMGRRWIIMQRMS